MSQNPSAQDQELWQEDQRIVLHLLHSYFAFDPTTLTNIFNHVFDDHLQACGITQGLEPRDIASQYRRRNHEWPDLLKKPTTKAGKRRRQNLFLQIRNAATAVDPSTDSPDDVNRSSDDGEVTIPKGWTIPTTADAERLLARQNKNMFGFQDLRLIEKGPRIRTRRSPRVSDPSFAADVTDTSSSGNKRRHDPEDDHNKRIRKATRRNENTASASDSKPRCSSDQADIVSERLEMLHWSDVNWEKRDKPWKEVTTIDRDSPIYKQGGQAHRITLEDGSEADIMLCSPAFCKTCQPSAGLTMESDSPISEIRALGLPFVHSSDTIRDEGVLVFEPRPKAHSRNVGGDCYRRLVSFWTDNGQLTCMAMVCGYGDCEICCADHMELELKCTAKKVTYRKGSR